MIVPRTECISTLDIGLRNLAEVAKTCGGDGGAETLASSAIPRLGMAPHIRMDRARGRRRLSPALLPE